MDCKVNDILAASRAAQANIYAAIREMHSLLETLRQYRIPDLATEGRPPAPDQAETSSARPRRRLSAMEITQDGDESAHEMNSRIERHIQSYKQAVADLRRNVDKVNALGADVPWLVMRQLDTSAVEGVDPADMDTYAALLAEKEALMQQVSQRNAQLHVSIDQLRDLCFVVSTLSAQGVASS